MWKQLQAHSKREKKKDFRWSKKKTATTKPTHKSSPPFPSVISNIAFPSLPSSRTLSIFSLSLSLFCSANLSDAWSPHHHHLTAEKQKKKYFSWTRNVFINYCVIVKQQKEKKLFEEYSHIFYISFECVII